MKLPQLLIVGAMKSGTTTLYDDLRHHPSIFFPIDKEPSFFCRPDSEDPDAVAEYAKIFARSSPDQVCAEASTGYTKRPTYEGVAERAKAVLGENLKVIYIVRDPVRRTISHHHHDNTLGECGPDINKAIHDHPGLLDYSKYAYQLEPWIEALGRDQVLILRFEDYMAHRQTGYDQVCQWLGLSRHDLKDPTRHMNASSEKPYHTGLWTVIAHSKLYRSVIRPLLPNDLKNKAHHILLPKAKTKLAPPSKETFNVMVDALGPDIDRVRKLMGHLGPVWDLEAHLRENTADPQSSSTDGVAP